MLNETYHDYPLEHQVASPVRKETHSELLQLRDDANGEIVGSESAASIEDTSIIHEYLTQSIVIKPIESLRYILAQARRPEKTFKISQPIF